MTEEQAVLQENKKAEVNYLKLGNDVYSVSKIDVNNLDVNKELSEFYEQRQGQLSEEFGKVLNEDMQSSWDTQIAHLRKFDVKGNFVIPNTKKNILHMIYKEKLIECRVIMYAPTQVVATRSWLVSYVPDLDMSTPMWENVSRNATYELTIIPVFHIPLIIGYSKKTGKLYTPKQQTYHTMHSGDICTGKHKGIDFWKLSTPALQAEINKVNTFSPATSSISIPDVGVYSFRDIITNATVIGVAGRDGATWQT